MQVFSALSSDSRIAMIKLLLKKDLCCTEISKKLDLDASTVSRHLKELEKTNIIRLTKKGNHVFCSIKNKHRIKKMLSLANKIKKR